MHALHNFPIIKTEKLDERIDCPQAYQEGKEEEISLSHCSLLLSIPKWRYFAKQKVSLIVKNRMPLIVMIYRCDERKMSYSQCHARLCGGGNLLKALGSVAFYLADALFNLSNDRQMGL